MKALRFEAGVMETTSVEIIDLADDFSAANLAEEIGFILEYARGDRERQNRN